MDRAAFLTYIEQCLTPTMHPGDVGIVEKLSAHKGAVITAAIERCGAQLIYLPPYSPDLNPIEMAFAKLKAHLRAAAACTLDTLTEKLAAALDTFLPVHCATFSAISSRDGYLKHPSRRNGPRGRLRASSPAPLRGSPGI